MLLQELTSAFPLALLCGILKLQPFTLFLSAPLLLPLLLAPLLLCTLQLLLPLRSLLPLPLLLLRLSQLRCLLPLLPPLPLRLLPPLELLCCLWPLLCPQLQQHVCQLLLPL
jgi:hypothetical protein